MPLSPPPDLIPCEPGPISILLSSATSEKLSGQIQAIARTAGCQVVFHIAPDNRQGSFPNCPAIDVAFYSRDIWQGSGLNTPNEASLAFFATLQRARQLGWLHVMSAGSDLPTYAAVRDRCVMTTSQGAGAIPIAQTVLASVLWRSRGFPAWQDAQARHVWARSPAEIHPVDLENQTAIVVGMGRVGSEIARHLRFVGTHTIGVRRGTDKHPHFDESHRLEELDSLLPGCDWLILACPLTTETQGLMNRSRLALMPRHSTLINVGRGGLVDEPALIEALTQGRIAGAHLDVFATEPLPATSPLWDLPKLTISPHASGLSSGFAALVDVIFLENFERWLAGAELKNRI